MVNIYSRSLKVMIITNLSMNLCGLAAKIAIWRWWLSDWQWHLNPFSSLHCFSHIWQYHRSFWSPFALILFAMAFGVKNPSFPMLEIYNNGLFVRRMCVVLLRSLFWFIAILLLGFIVPVNNNDVHVSPCRAANWYFLNGQIQWFSHL